MTSIKVDFTKTVGTIKPMHGVGQPPFVGVDFSMIRYLKEAGVPYSRLHDVGGGFGGNLWVDIPNIFRDFSADADDPASYDFAFTDRLITALVENGVEPFFRLGVTIENYAAIRAYRIFPPADNEKWAVICEHIIRHYTEGWADGFRYKIEYWEIWNEPDNYEDPLENQMWRGTKEQYFELYRAASTHLKRCFPHLKIGGYASCGFYSIEDGFVPAAASSPRTDYFIAFFDAFLAYIREHDCPLDFFSWHSYDTVERNILYAHYARERLDAAGYTGTETTCNEWNSDVNARGTYRHAALTAAMMLAFQNTPLDSAMFYDAGYGTSVYRALFHPLTKAPFPAYYAFTAFNRLYTLGDQVDVQTSCNGLYVVAAANGKCGCIVLANPTGEDIPMDWQFVGTVTRCLLTAADENEKTVALPAVLPKESILTVEVSL